MTIPGIGPIAATAIIALDPPIETFRKAATSPPGWALRRASTQPAASSGWVAYLAGKAARRPRRHVPISLQLSNLFAEQIGVRAGALEMNAGGVNLIDQQPIRLYVEIAIADRFLRMVTQPRRYRRFLDQQLQDMAQLRHVLAALLRSLHVTAELAGIGWVAHSNTQLPEQVSRVLGRVNVLAT